MARNNLNQAYLSFLYKRTEDSGPEDKKADHNRCHFQISLFYFYYHLLV